MSPDRDIENCRKTISLLRTTWKRRKVSDYQLLQQATSCLVTLGIIVLVWPVGFFKRHYECTSVGGVMSVLHTVFGAIWLYLLWRVVRARKLFEKHKPQNLSEIESMTE